MPAVSLPRCRDRCRTYPISVPLSDWIASALGERPPALRHDGFRSREIPRKSNHFRNVASRPARSHAAAPRLLRGEPTKGRAMRTKSNVKAGRIGSETVYLYQGIELDRHVAWV